MVVALCWGSRRPDRSIADILEPDTVLETYQEEIDAVKSFFPGRVVPRYDILKIRLEAKGAVPLTIAQVLRQLSRKPPIMN